MIYMDNAATSRPKPDVTYDSMDRFMREVGASPGRSGHQLSIKAARIIYEARESVAAVFGLDNPLRIIFASGATESLNLVIKGLLHPRDHIITSGLEHNSVMRPLRQLEVNGCTLTVVTSCEAQFPSENDFRKAIRPNTRLLILSHASNVVGTVNHNISAITSIAHAYGILVCLDAAQTAGAYPTNAKETNIDFIAFTGHKSLFGPVGTGGLYIRDGIEELLEPLTRGGTGSYSEHEHQPDFLPDKYESGTPNAVGIAGLGAGARFIISEGIREVRRKEEKLTSLLIDGLKSIPGVTLYGTGDAKRQIAVVSFNIDSLSSSRVAIELEEDYGIMCRPGLHCAPLAHKTIGTFPEGTVRLSPGYFNTEEEIDICVKAISRIAAVSIKDRSNKGDRW